MRPVTRNNPAHYVLTPNTLITIPDATAQNTLSANGCNKVNGNQYPLGQIQSFMARMVVRANSPGGGCTNKQKKTMNYLTDYIFVSGTNGNFSYKDAKLDLINGLGQFCNYCGVRINDYSLAVEHCLPKSQFPDEMMNYDNFLLACPECNSSNKKANPTYAFGLAQANANPPPGPPPNYPTYNDIKRWAVDYYVWPSPIINAAWGNFQGAYAGFVAIYYSNFTVNPFAKNQVNVNGTITDVRNTLTATTNGLVSGQIYPPAAPPPLNSTFGIDFGYNPPLGTPMHMGTLVGINNFSPNNLHASDRRVFNRTVVWFHACTAFKQFALITGLNLPQQAEDDLMNNALAQMYSTASESGFWEVWADLLFKKGGAGPKPPNPNPNPSVYDRFRTATTAQNNTYFPGTNLQFIP